MLHLFCRSLCTAHSQCAPLFFTTHASDALQLDRLLAFSAPILRQWSSFVVVCMMILMIYYIGRAEKEEPIIMRSLRVTRGSSRRAAEDCTSCCCLLQTAAYHMRL